MIPRIPVNKLIDSSALSAGIFITSGCYKTYKDFENYIFEKLTFFLSELPLLVYRHAIDFCVLTLDPANFTKFFDEL